MNKVARSLPAQVALIERAFAEGKELDIDKDGSIQLAGISTRVSRSLANTRHGQDWIIQERGKLIERLKQSLEECAQNLPDDNNGKYSNIKDNIKRINQQSGFGEIDLERYHQLLTDLEKSDPSSSLSAMNVGSLPSLQSQAAARMSANLDNVEIVDLEEEPSVRNFSKMTGTFTQKLDSLITSKPTDEFLEKIGDPSNTRWGDALNNILNMNMPGDVSVGRLKSQKALNESAQTLQSHFISFYNETVDSLRANIPNGDPRRYEFDANCASDLQAILATHFPPDTNTKSPISLATQALRAQYDARKSLLDLRNFVFGPACCSKAVQIIPFTNKESGEMLFNALRPAPAIETLAFSGGGMKAVGIGAAIEEFTRFGGLKDVKKLVGSSAGALTSTFLSVGMQNEQFNDVNTQLASFKSAFLPSSDGQNVMAQYPKLGTSGGLSDSQRMIVALDIETAKIVGAYVLANEKAIIEAVDRGTITPDDATHIARLGDQDYTAANREPMMVTFRDLKILHQLAPHSFRELALTGFMPAEQKLAVFDAENTPDLPIAYAARASMAAPLAFSAVTLEGITYIDGGLGTNQPVDIVHGSKQGIELEDSIAKTVLFSYAADGDTMKALYEPATPPSLIGSTFQNALLTLFGKRGAVEADAADAVRQKQMGLQTLVVHHGNLGSFDFLASRERKEFAVAHSRIMMQEQLLMRENQGMSRVYSKAADVVASLTNDDISTFLENYRDVEIPSDRKALEPAESAMFDLLIAMRQSRENQALS